MENLHFNDVLLDLKPSDIDNNFFRTVAENHGVEMAARDARFRFLGERDASTCIRLAREACDVMVVGNHDLHAIRKLPEFRAGIEYPETYWQLSSAERKEFAAEERY